MSAYLWVAVVLGLLPAVIFGIKRLWREPPPGSIKGRMPHPTSLAATGAPPRPPDLPLRWPLQSSSPIRPLCTSAPEIPLAPPPMVARHFNDQVAVRDGIAHAYRVLGLKQEQTGPGCSRYPPRDWNLAGLITEHAASHYSRLYGSCRTCHAALNFHTVIRCLDCKSPLCERCAVDHFAAAHPSRAAAAHLTAAFGPPT